MSSAASLPQPKLVTIPLSELAATFSSSTSSSPLPSSSHTIYVILKDIHPCKLIDITYCKCHCSNRKAIVTGIDLFDPNHKITSCLSVSSASILQFEPVIRKYEIIDVNQQDRMMIVLNHKDEEMRLQLEIKSDKGKRILQQYQNILSKRNEIEHSQQQQEKKNNEACTTSSASSSPSSTAVSLTANDMSLLSHICYVVVYYVPRRRQPFNDKWTTDYYVEGIVDGEAPESNSNNNNNNNNNSNKSNIKHS